MSEGLRLLYIDDDEGLCRLAARTLARLGYVIDTAQDGATGCRMAAAVRYDAVAVDHYMPGMDGLATLACLREAGDPAPVVYVTGSEEGRVAVAALKAGAVDYVVKTVGEDFFSLLDSAVRQAIERRALERGKRAAEEELRDSNARLETLLREVNHRVANSLQVVAALVQLQATALANPLAQGALLDTRRRIEAIAQVHRRLYTGHAVDRVAIDDYLAALAVELEETWSTMETPYAIRLTCEPIVMQADRAVSLGVIVNELVSNACKYAYPAGVGGEVRIGLSRADGDRFRLVVEDDGCGIDEAAAPRGTGVGSRVIAAMARSLRGTLDYTGGERGVRVALVAALG